MQERDVKDENVKEEEESFEDDGKQSNSKKVNLQKSFSGKPIDYMKYENQKSKDLPISQ